jgi:hypothetical protein
VTSGFPGPAGADAIPDASVPGRGFERLGPPPRHVPLALRLRLSLGGFPQIGFFLLLFSTPFFWLFAANADLSGVLVRGQLTRTTGTVVRVTDTHASEGKVAVQRVEYVFRVAGSGERRGTSYVTGAAPRTGESVVVEYPAGRPRLSRIEGMRRSMFGPGALVALVFPLVGLVLAGFGVRHGMRRVRLLEHGSFALATLKSTAETNVRVNKRPVIAMCFEFTDLSGQRHEVVERTTDTAKLSDDRREAMLYDPERPSRAVVADSLPESVRVDEAGQLEAAGAGAAAAALVLPLLVLAANAWALLRVLP